ncbi:dihydrofolate reductase family protein [Kribbella hippodromi]|uniref:Dihydrofolate reductase family protein n=1 Tax=Kribbella hippodromi TaxID=434347 RepID=A0ABN2CT61_9ACTN
MGDVIVSAVVSLDGFVADTEDQVGPLFDWYNNGPVEVYGTDPDRPFQMSQASADFARSIWPNVAVCVAGRRLFDLTDGWRGVPPVGEHIVIITHEPPTDWAYPGTPLHFTRSVEEGIAKARELAGDRDISVSAGNLTGQLLTLGLADVLSLQVVPVVFGTGRPFFGDYTGDQILFDNPQVVEGNRVTHLHYRITR